MIKTIINHFNFAGKFKEIFRKRRDKIKQGLWYYR